MNQEKCHEKKGEEVLSLIPVEERIEEDADV